MTTKTNKELLESCKTHLEYGIDDIVTPIMDDFQELFTRFEKQIPKKPVRLAGNILFACPNDRWHQMTVDNSRKFPYCPVCGQALDWSDVK